MTNLSECPGCGYDSGLRYQVRLRKDVYAELCCVCVVEMIKGPNGFAVKHNNKYLWEARPEIGEKLLARDYFHQREKFLDNGGIAQMDKMLSCVTLTYPDLDDIVWKKEMTNKNYEPSVLITVAIIIVAFIIGFMISYLQERLK